MDFSGALKWLKNGSKMSRQAWNNIDHFVYMVRGSSFHPERPPLSLFYSPKAVVDYSPHLDVCTAYGKHQPYTPTNDDLFAEDWMVVE